MFMITVMDPFGAFVSQAALTHQNRHCCVKLRGLIYEGKRGGNGNTFVEESTGSSVINHIFCFLSATLSTFQNNELYKRQTVFQILEQHSVGTTSRPVLAFATLNRKNKVFHFPKLLALAKHLTTQI